MVFFLERCCSLPRPRLGIWPAGPGAGAGWVGASCPLPVTRVPTRSCRTSYCNHPRSPPRLEWPPAAPRASSWQWCPPAQLTRAGGVRQVVVGRSAGKLPQFPAAQAQHPGHRRLLQCSIEGAAPRDRARTRAGAWATVNTGEVTSRRYWARVFCSRGHSDQARGRHFPADNSPTRRLSACAAELMGGRGKGHTDPGRFPSWAGLRWPSADPSVCLRPWGFQGKIKRNSEIWSIRYSRLPVSFLKCLYQNIFQTTLLLKIYLLSSVH